MRRERAGSLFCSAEQPEPRKTGHRMISCLSGCFFSDSRVYTYRLAEFEHPWEVSPGEPGQVDQVN